MALSHGTLENEILNAVWTIEEEGLRGDCITVADIAERINANGSIRAYTTIKTVMDRLTEKNMLVRRKNSRKFCYSSARPRRHAAHEAVDKLVRQYFRNDMKLLMKMLEEECLSAAK